MGTTTCAVALASRRERVFVLDLALATGDAAEVAGAQVAIPDALLRIACGPVTTPAELAAGLAVASTCRVLPAPVLPEHADLIDEHGIARVLDLAVASGLRAIVDCGSRVGVETVPALERASLIAIVASADARGARGARRTSLLLARLGLAGCALGLVVTNARNARAAATIATQVALPLLAAVKADARVPRARERGLPPPAASSQRSPPSQRHPSHEPLGAGPARRRCGSRSARAASGATAGPAGGPPADPTVTEVIVNGPTDCGSSAAAACSARRCGSTTPSALRDACVRLAARAGRRLDDAQPMVDARLADGSRLNVVLPPLAPDGPLLTLRRFAPRPFTLAELVELGSLSTADADLLDGCVRARCRC